MAEVRAPTLGEAVRFAEILAESFGVPSERAEHLVQDHLPDRIRVILADGVVRGGLFVDPQAQSWGGRAVSAVCIGAVAIDPADRRRGFATALLSAVLLESRARGTALAVLHASNHALYRSLGFEHAGLRWVFQVRPTDIVGHPRAANVRRLTPADRPQMEALYTSAVAPHRDGALLRSDLRWERALGLDRDDKPWWVGAFDHQDRLAGYVVWTSSGRMPDRVVHVGDFVATTAEAGDALRGVLAQLEATVARVELAVAPDDPLFWHLRHPHGTTLSSEAFLVRVLDPSRAVAAWGFPESATGAVRFEWHDPLFLEDDGQVSVQVDSGQGRWSVEAVSGSPTSALGPRGLTALLCGRAAPAELSALTGETVDLAEPWVELFPRRSVWLRDMF